MSVKLQVEASMKQMSGSDQMLRELQSRESDLMEALKAKDSQLAVLRVRLEEMDKEIAGKNQALSILESQRERWDSFKILVSLPTNSHLKTGSLDH